MDEMLVNYWLLLNIFSNSLVSNILFPYFFNNKIEGKITDC